MAVSKIFMSKQKKETLETNEANEKQEVSSSNAENEKKLLFIDLYLDWLSEKGYLPIVSVSVIRPVGPSSMNRGENGEQKVITYGNVPRMIWSSHSKLRPMRKQMDYIHTSIVNRVISDKVRERRPDLPEKVYIFIKETLDGMFKSKMLSLSVYEIREMCDLTVDYIDSIEIGWITEYSGDMYEKEKDRHKAKVQKKIKDAMGKTAFERRTGRWLSDMGRLCTDNEIRTIYGAVFVAPAMSVTPYRRESDFHAASDDYMDGLRDLVGDPYIHGGASHLGDEDMNAAIMLEFYARNSRMFVRNMMQMYDPYKDDDWEEVLKMSDENNALFFDMFLKILPEGGQHKKLTMPNPSAVYIRSSNEMPYTADGLYSYPCLSANPAKEACDRLANFAMDSTFESTYLKQKKYWISDRNMGEYELGDKVQKVDSVSQMMDIFLSRDYLLGDKREVKELVSSCRNEAGK